jgi:magnesium chelatase family protein
MLSQQHSTEESSASVKQRVVAARDIQLARQGKANARLSGSEIADFCPLVQDDARFLEDTIHRFKLSARTYHKIIKVARTIADLQQQPKISRAHLMEALSYRALERLLSYLKT